MAGPEEQLRRERQCIQEDVCGEEKQRPYAIKMKKSDFGNTLRYFLCDLGYVT